MSTDLGTWLRTQREERGWSRSETARRLITAARETGDGSMPDAETIRGTGCAARGFTGSFPLCSGSRVGSRVQPDRHRKKGAYAGFPGHEPEPARLTAAEQRRASGTALPWCGGLRVETGAESSMRG
jgi:hypothetical protein